MARLQVVIQVLLNYDTPDHEGAAVSQLGSKITDCVTKKAYSSLKRRPTDTWKCRSRCSSKLMLGSGIKSILLPTVFHLSFHFLFIFSELVFKKQD